MQSHSHLILKNTQQYFGHMHSIDLFREHVNMSSDLQRVGQPMRLAGTGGHKYGYGWSSQHPCPNRAIPAGQAG